MKTLLVLLSIAFVLALTACGDYDKVEKRAFWVYVPCPQITGSTVETILSNFIDNTATSSIQGVLPPGTYTSADGRGCVFTIDNNSRVTW